MFYVVITICGYNFTRRFRTQAAAQSVFEAINPNSAIDSVEFFQNEEMLMVKR